MPTVAGRQIPLSLPRCWIADLMHLCRGVPVASVERVFDLSKLVQIRGSLKSPPSWLSLLIKAYASTAKRIAPLRRSYHGGLFPYLFEAEKSIASVAVSREFDGESAVFFGLLNGPENQSLPQISHYLQDFRTKPIPEIHSFRRLVRITKYPKWIRRMLWWYGYHWSGARRAKNFGTFGVSALGSSGVTLLDLVFPLGSTFTVGPIGEDGKMLTRLFFDHRVLDGSTAAEAMLIWERTLNDEILLELRGLENPE
jgi:hypothetical protein